jgi:hypothetical protein
MYRVRSVIKVTQQGWPGAIENVARINEVAKQRGWQQATVWTQTFGPFNELSIELEYPDLATYEHETAAFYADDEAMKLVFDGMKLRRGEDPGYNDIWQRVDTADHGT